MKSFKSLREGVQYGGGGSRERRSVKGTYPEWRSKFEAHLFKHHPEHKGKKLDHEQVEYFYNTGRSHEGAADYYHKMHEAGELNEEITSLPYSYVMKKIQSGVWESKSAVTRGARVEIREKHGNKKKFILVKEDKQLDEVKMRGPHSFMRKSTVKDVKYDAPWHVQPQGKTLDRAPSANTSLQKNSTALHEEDISRFIDKKMKKEKLTMPLKGHEYHYKTDAELHYISKDAHAAAKHMQGHDSKAEGKYLDQVNDAQTVIGFRRRGGMKLEKAKTPLHEGYKLGDSIHLGFGAKGGAGYFGTIHKIEGEKVHVKVGRDKYGDKIVTGPLKHVTLEKELAESQLLPEMSGANWKTRDIHHHLKKLGWALSRTSGSHDVYEHPHSKERIAVPRHKQLKAPLINGILKQSHAIAEDENPYEKTRRIRDLTWHHGLPEHEFHRMEKEYKEKLKKKMDHSELKEGLTGPTRMQIQQYLDSTVGSLRSRIYRTEQACGVYDIRLNSQGDVIHFSVTPHHAIAIDPTHTGHQIAYAMHEGKIEQLPSTTDHTQNPHHKVLTQHGFVHVKSFDTKNLGHSSHHIYTHPDHGRSHVEIMHHVDGSGKMTTHNTSWHHRYEQDNGILAPSYGDSKPSLNKDLTRQYKKSLAEGSRQAQVIRELFEKGKPTKKEKDEDPEQTDKPGKKKEVKVGEDDGEKITLSGKKEKFFKEPTLNSINYMSGQGIG